MMEGSGAGSVLVTNVSGTPKNIRILDTGTFNRIALDKRILEL
jgi:hypothetical protein